MYFLLAADLVVLLGMSLFAVLSYFKSAADKDIKGITLFAGSKEFIKAVYSLITHTEAACTRTGSVLCYQVLFIRFSIEYENRVLLIVAICYFLLLHYLLKYSSQ